MKSYLPPSAYWSEAVFDQERAHFERQWQFAGFRRDLRQHHDFVTLQIGRRPVVVQNFDGELKAYDNVCSHRFSRIQTEPCGNRALQCRYHGWAYNSHGDPVGIPQRPRFDDLAALPTDALRLPSWKVATLGELVFVTRERNGSEFNEFLGSGLDELTVISESLGPLIDVNRKVIRANWKVVVENTLEAYHVDFVHVNNFKKLLADPASFEFHAPHSWWRSSLRESVTKAMAPLERLLGSRAYRPLGYVHAFVFPNLTIATTLGTSFSIQHFIPRSVGETEFVSYLFATRVANEKAESSPIFRTLLDNAIQFNRDVFEEDRNIVEQVQLGIRHAERPGVLSQEEVRIQAFQEDYVKQFGFAEPFRNE